MSIEWRNEAEELRGHLVALRRDFHRHPELAFQEVRTAGVVVQSLKDCGWETRDRIGGTGVLGILTGGLPGPAVLLRVDMDALPIQESPDCPYGSTNAGVMHACGHDGHTAIGIGAARLLAGHRAELAGRVLLLFQPGEETLGGAKSCIDSGALAELAPGAAFGFHLWNDVRAGKVCVQSGSMMAAADIVKITLLGRSGHGALPHQGVDAIAAAGQVISALQTIVSRNVDPQETAVLSLGTIQGGTAFNVLAESVELGGTIRTFSPAVRQTVLTRLEVLLQGVTSAMGARYELEVTPVAPAVINDPAATEVARAAVVAVAGADALTPHLPLMPSEDFAEYLALMPGCYYLLGSGNRELGLMAAHHSPQFDFDEGVLPLGAAILAGIAHTYLARTAATRAN
jgi:amidohydrolase